MGGGILGWGGGSGEVWRGRGVRGFHGFPPVATFLFLCVLGWGVMHSATQRG